MIINILEKHIQEPFVLYPNRNDSFLFFNDKKIEVHAKERIYIRFDRPFIRLNHRGKSHLTSSIQILFQEDEGHFTVETKNLQREYSGRIELGINGGRVFMHNIVPKALYLTGVVLSEYPLETPVEAMRALYVVVNTRYYFKCKREKEYDYSDLTSHQVYRGISIELISKRSNDFSALSRMVLTKNEELRDVFFHSTCGGYLYADSIWSLDPPGHPFNNKQGVMIRKDKLDGNVLCRESPHFKWEYLIKAEALHLILREAIKERVHEVKSISPEDTRVCLQTDEGERRMGIDRFRLIINRKQGWHRVKSNHFALEKRGDSYYFTGRGLGHNVGLCQYGAIRLARMGKTWREILSHYFPEFSMRRL